MLLLDCPNEGLLCPKLKAGAGLAGVLEPKAGAGAGDDPKAGAAVVEPNEGAGVLDVPLEPKLNPGVL